MTCIAAGCWREVPAHQAAAGVRLCDRHQRDQARLTRQALRTLQPVEPAPNLFGLVEPVEPVEPVHLALPALPYDGTSGHAGSDASDARATAADSDGTTGRRQARTVALLHQAGPGGLTWAELGEATGWHHGTASGALSALHRAGMVVRLVEQRNGSHVYVHPLHQGDRPADKPRPVAGTRAALDVLAAVDGLLAAGQVDAARQVVATARRVLGG